MHESSLYEAAELYDVISRGVPGDLEFYLEAARQSPGPILELGCGTGRVLHAIAAAGLEVWGLDISEAMLARATDRLARLPRPLQDQAHLDLQPMESFHLNMRFGLVLIPYRAFQHLLTPAAQARCLHRIRRHLLPEGKLIIDLFDPRLDWLLEPPTGSPMQRRLSLRHPTRGTRVILYVTRRVQQTRQWIREDWIFEEVDGHGNATRRTYHSLKLRYTFRFEMQHLLCRCGFRIEQLLGDFHGGPFRAGAEQIWIASPRFRSTRKPTSE